MRAIQTILECSLGMDVKGADWDLGPHQSLEAKGIGGFWGSDAEGRVMNCVETSVIGAGGIGNSVVSDIVMINFMSQLGYATVPRYLVKHYFRCFCEGIFLIGLTFKSVLSWLLNNTGLIFLGLGNSLEVQWLRLRASTEEGTSLIPNWGIKILLG